MPGFEIIGEDELKSVSDIFINGGGVLFAHGFEHLRNTFHVRSFERELSQFFSNNHVQCTSSGTAALKCALKAAGVSPGDEVITQAFNFAATVEAIFDCGAQPVVVGVDDDLFISPSELESKINNKTKAVVSVHMLGMGGHIEEVSNLCKSKNVIHIEDNCESIGALYGNKPLGTFSDIGVVSFDHGKIITSGEGGAVITSNSEFYNYVRSYSDHGHAYSDSVPRGRDPRVMPGFNYRMTELQAAVGRVQLTKLSKIISLNKQRFDILHNELAKTTHVRKYSSDMTPNFDTFMFRLPDPSLKEEVLEIIKLNKFSTKNIPDAMEWHCSYFWPHILTSAQVNASKSTFDILNEYISLPIFINRSLDEYARLATSLASFLK